MRDQHTARQTAASRQRWKAAEQREHDALRARKNHLDGVLTEEEQTNKLFCTDENDSANYCESRNVIFFAPCFWPAPQKDFSLLKKAFLNLGIIGFLFVVCLTCSIHSAQYVLKLIYQDFCQFQVVDSILSILL